MKTTEITTLRTDGEDFLVSEETLAKYPDTAKHTWSFAPKRLRTSDVRKIDASLYQKKNSIVPMAAQMLKATTLREVSKS